MSTESAAPFVSADTSSSPLPVEAAAAFQRLTTGVALAIRGSWTILLANELFSRWFAPATGDDNLLTRLPELDVVVAQRRLSEGSRYELNVERRVKGRTVVLEVVLIAVSDGQIQIEARDDQKRRRAEYMLDSYARMAEKNLRDLEQEKARVERLLLNLMPRAVLQEMREFGTVSPQRFATATALMLDFVDFSEMAVARDPAALVAELNDIFSAFDRISEMFGCERIKTNGDSYMAVCGLPEPADDHAANVAHAALRMRGYIDRRNRSNSNQWRCRIGIASGPLVGSIVGVNKYVYDVFGPAVNLAARLEKLAAPMEILVSQATADQLGSALVCASRDVCTVKGFGSTRIFELLGPGGTPR